MKSAKAILIIASILLVGLITQKEIAEQTQTCPEVNFTISPTTFPVGQSTSALLCLSPSNTAAALTSSVTKGPLPVFHQGAKVC
jgi:hypothetical protein